MQANRSNRKLDWLANTPNRHGKLRLEEHVEHEVLARGPARSGESPARIAAHH
jgi:hypothetical protein